MIKKLLVFLFFAIALIVYTHRLPQAFYVDTDFARDAYNILGTLRGDLSLIGPPLSIGAFAGPYYHYLFVPTLLAFNLEEVSFLIFNAILFAGFLTIIFVLLIRRCSWTIAVLATSFLGLAPFWIGAARHPGNAFTYLPLLVVFAVVILMGKSFSKLNASMLGALGGLILNFHPISIFAVLPLTTILIYKFRSKALLTVFILSGLLTFTPLVLFELKHDFQILKNVFLAKHINQFDGALPTVYHTAAKSNPLENYIFLAHKASGLLGYPVELLWGGSLLALLALRRSKFQIYLFSLGPVSFLATSFAARNLFEPHYLLPTLLLSVIAFLFFVLISRKHYLLVCLLLLSLIKFPHQLYQNTSRSLHAYRAVFAHTIENMSIAQGAPFNLIEILEPYHYVPAGYMYRYHFAKYEYNVLPTSDYNTANYLLVFSDEPSFDPQEQAFYEIDQFDKNQVTLIPSHPSFSTQVYLLPKR